MPLEGVRVDRNGNIDAVWPHLHNRTIARMSVVISGRHGFIGACHMCLLSQWGPQRIGVSTTANMFQMCECSRRFLVGNNSKGQC